VAFLADRLGLRPGATVVDLAAGTGKLSELLVGTGARVVGVEPVEGMRRRLERVPGVQAIAGTAEAIPLPDGAADAVTVAEAFHWFRFGDALAEIHRVLRPGGSVALLWNRVETPAFDATLARFRGHALVGGADRGRGAFERSALFTPLEATTFPHEQELDAAALADRVASESSIVILPEERRREAVAAVRALAPLVLRYVAEIYVSDRATLALR